MALGGWLGTLADPGGSRSGRARPLAAFVVLGAAVVALSEAGARSMLAASGIVAGVAFVATMLRALGPSAGTVGTMLSIVAAIATGSRVREPLRDAQWFVAGGALAVVLSTIVWPVWTHLPVRRAVAAVFQELAAYVRDLEECLASGAPEDDPRWAVAARLHTRRIRDALDKARAVSLAIHARRAGESPRGSNLRVLLGMADAQFLLLVTLASEIETSSARPRPLDLRAFLGSIAETYDAVSTVLVALTWRAQAPAPERATSPPPDVSGNVLRELMSDLARESDAARATAGALDRREANLAPVEARADAVRGVLAVDWSLVRDSLLPGSPLLHHAVRVALAGAVAVVAGQLLSPQHAPWVTVTALAVLQPDAGATVKRAAERVVGTVLGILVAVALAATGPGPVALGVAMFPLSIAAVVTRPRSYRLFTLFLTPIFLLIAMRSPGGGLWAAAARAGDTLAGGAIALLATLFLFPRWEERVGMPEALAEMERDAQAYATSVVASLGAREGAGPVPASQEMLRKIRDARLKAAGALGRAEAVLERLLESPLRSEGESEAMALLTYARRLTNATTTLHTLASKRSAGSAASIEAALLRIHRFEALLHRAAACPRSTRR
jgi:uncharacterized membrane protein YccC